jgi:hypothetical protein
MKHKQMWQYLKSVFSKYSCNKELKAMEEIEKTVKNHSHRVISPKKLSGLLGENFGHGGKYYLSSPEGYEMTFFMSDSFYVMSYDNITYKVYTLKHDTLKHVHNITNHSGSWRLDNI